MSGSKHTAAGAGLFYPITTISRLLQLDETQAGLKPGLAEGFEYWYLDCRRHLAGDAETKRITRWAVP